MNTPEMQKVYDLLHSDAFKQELEVVSKSKPKPHYFDRSIAYMYTYCETVLKYGTKESFEEVQCNGLVKYAADVDMYHCSKCGEWTSDVLKCTRIYHIGHCQ